VGQIAAGLGAGLSGSGNPAVFDVTHDSRQARDGSLFAAIRGLTVDGHRFIEDVMRRGAVGVISELERPKGFAGTWLRVGDAREALAKAASIVYGNPSRDLKLVGITGTNGKTTTTYLCFSLAVAAGERAAMLTTVEYRINKHSEPAVRTTPEASDTNKFLRRALDDGCLTAVMETSSQAIDLHRCDGLQFSVAIFTNLTRDHLDYHLTMENYFDAKRKLFDGRLGERPASSIINIDDEWGRRLADGLRAEGARVLTCSQAGEADLTASEVEVSLMRGTTFLLRTPAGERRVTSPLVGRPHVYNMLSATGAALELGYGLDAVARGLEKCLGAPGRFERVPHDRDFAIVVDYAHSDDALLNTLGTASKLTRGRVICVFGCGGDRDKTKRAPMGEIAGKCSDLVVITSDNPRTEDPMAIIAQIEEGTKRTTTPYLVVPDRREAIFQAISKAKAGDVVLICGKGHETYQVVGNEKYHFDDREVALDALARIDERE
jgi:UDP-N-acetylmuramoyl-L-alanyl-D-glutamate--2,6-diaminopimelate ligase